MLLLFCFVQNILFHKSMIIIIHQNATFISFSFNIFQLIRECFKRNVNKKGYQRQNVYFVLKSFHCYHLSFNPLLYLLCLNDNSCMRSITCQIHLNIVSVSNNRRKQFPLFGISNVIGKM